jgi:hypothetical protein
MGCDCDRLDYGGQLLAPLECKKILGPFEVDFVLTDVVFELFNSPSGASSRGCGDVHNVLPLAWSRQLLGGEVGVSGRQYNLQSGIVCPAGSYLNVCNCLFVEGPTAWISARVTGCYCPAPSSVAGAYRGELSTTRQGSDLQAKCEIDPVDPTGAAERRPLPVQRELLATGHEAVGPGAWAASASGRAVSLRPGTAAALRVRGGGWTWTSAGNRLRAPRLPAGTSLVAARRSADGLLVHWSAYREVPIDGPARRTRGGRGRSAS